MHIVNFSYEFNGEGVKDSFSYDGAITDGAVFDAVEDYLLNKFDAEMLIPAKPRGGDRNDYDDIFQKAMKDKGVTNIKVMSVDEK